MNLKGIFKKKTKGEENYTNEPKETTIDGVEVLDFDNNKPVTNLEEKKENRTIILILIIILVFALALPKVTSWFKKSSIFSYTDTVNDVVNDKTVDGMLQIGKEEGSITAKNVKFYNFKKGSNSSISVVYLPETAIKDVDKSNIYIELYNSKKTIIYRTKFTSTTKLERKVQRTFNFKVLEDTYKDAKYAKITVIKEQEWGTPNKNLVCTKEATKSGYTLTEKITYNFSDLGLINYKVSKRSIKNQEDTDTQVENPFSKDIEKESKMIDKTNIKDLNSDESSIEYSVDLANLELGTSGYTPLHAHGNIYRTVRLEELYNGWVCE